MGSLPDTRAVAHSKYRDRSHALLEAARVDAGKKRQYNSEATRTIITQECQKRAQVIPYPEQLDLAECMLLGLDAVSIAGTGWGKTLPFVLPLFVPETKGKMIVIISPLNALEEDQAKRFEKMGLTAIALNGQTNNTDVLTQIRRGAYSVVIMGPKLLVGEGGGPVRSLFSQPRFTRKILGLVIDEAHCITQWGSDFRPEYAELGSIRALLSLKAAVHATSATMPPPVLEQACKTLLIDLANAFILNLGNDRPNVTWDIIYMTAGKSDLDCLACLRPKGDLSVLCRLEKTMVFFDDILQSMRARRWLVNQLPEALRERVKGYHSRRSDLGKSLVMRDFREGKVDMLFTTEAAGMGCDIPDIAHVVQYMAPDSLSILVQRAGRAGRRPDMQAKATLLVQPSVFQEMGKKTRRDNEPVVYKKELEPGLRKLVDAPEDQCLRDVTDEYFDNPPGRRAPIGECCVNCTRRKQKNHSRNSAATPPAAMTSPNTAPLQADGEVPTAAISERETEMDECTAQLQVVAVPADRFAAENWRSFLTATRAESDVEAAKEALTVWRQTCWRQHYSHQPFGASALLPEPAFTTLATRTAFRSVADLHALKWRLAERHGAEVIALLEAIDHKVGLKRLGDEKKKHDDAMAAKAEKEREKRVRDELRDNERRNREVERELDRFRRQAEATKKKEEAKRVKATERERKAAAKRRAAGVKAASRAIEYLANAQSVGESFTPRTSRKRRGEGVEESRPTKRACVEKENMVPPAMSGMSAGGDRPAALATPARPKPRPRPIRRPVAIPTPPSTPSNGGCPLTPGPAPASVEPVQYRRPSLSGQALLPPLAPIPVSTSTAPIFALSLRMIRPLASRHLAPWLPGTRLFCSHVALLRMCRLSSQDQRLYPYLPSSSKTALLGCRSASVRCLLQNSSGSSSVPIPSSV